MDSLYSAMVIDADVEPLLDVRLFDYGQSQNTPGSHQLATAAHTNIPRPGMSGLPTRWEFYISRWQAKTNLRLDEPLMDWAAETSVRLYYNNRSYSTTPLLDLLMAPRAFYDLSSDDPANRNGQIWMRESISYWVDIQMQPEATEHLQEYLLQHTRGHRMILWIYLDGALRMDVQ